MYSTVKTHSGRARKLSSKYKGRLRRIFVTNMTVTTYYKINVHSNTDTFKEQSTNKNKRQLVYKIERVKVTIISRMAMRLKTPCDYGRKGLSREK